ncbi:hypothetical protein KUTeg_006951 [Tegillarca granosa]|uniref:Tyrosinase copper-binding domain-containing protein n=1 Tax=Tegillarca granosa TaxID=220873 RepID=A0ABQ9FF13_TEGGR|nr:hypothetical protein KUTeg_006951 [Tegillarca granosa]
MWRGICTIAILSVIFTLSCALIEEINPPDDFLACLVTYQARSNGSDSTWQSLSNFCLQRHRNRRLPLAAHIQQWNISKDTTEWSVRPNRYDALALIHLRMTDRIHHGSAFLAWHRIFITIRSLVNDTVIDPLVCDKVVLPRKKLRSIPKY